MTGRREVRVAESFFEELDSQLGAERGSSGEPSATDFLVIDLPTIVEAFATGFDELPSAIEGLESARMFIGTGTLVQALVVHGIETTEGVIDLVGVEIQL